jgi:hypothetical protein
MEDKLEKPDVVMATSNRHTIQTHRAAYPFEVNATTRRPKIPWR